VNAETIAGGRYRVQRPLGDGAMAKVVLAKDAELGRNVAVKVLDEHVAADPEFRARFAREARLAAALSHPNLVTIFDAGEAEGSPYIVMEYVDGATLEDRLRREGRLDPNDVRAIAVQVCAGLAHAHASGLVHRDLKPGNLIQRNDGTVKIADFGIARGDATELTEAGTIVGTAAYLAPEQAEASSVTPQTDLYALGVVLYELLTGGRPWRVETLADLGRRRADEVPPLPAEIPSDLRRAIVRCLAPDPAARPGSASELADMLTRVDEGATAVLPAQARFRRPAEALSRASRLRVPGLWIALALLALLVLLAAVGIAALAGGGGEEPARVTPQPVVQPIPDGATPNEDARNLARWLRENAGR
jgi:serine/threonine protein kinase